MTVMGKRVALIGFSLEEYIRFDHLVDRQFQLETMKAEHGLENVIHELRLTDPDVVIVTASSPANAAELAWQIYLEDLDNRVIAYAERGNFPDWLRGAPRDSGFATCVGSLSSLLEHIQGLLAA